MMDSSQDWLDGRSPKKARFEDPIDSPPPPSDTYDDTEELYNEDQVTSTSQVPPVGQRDPVATTSSPQSSAILPGLGLLQSVPHLANSLVVQAEKLQVEFQDGTNPDFAELEGNGFGHNEDKDSKLAGAGSSPILANPAIGSNGSCYSISQGCRRSDGMGPTGIEDTSLEPITIHGADLPQATVTIDEGAQEFMRFAETNKDDIEAEWQYDSSDADSDSSDSSESSEESEMDGYKLLSAEEQARILMAEEGGSDDEGRRGVRDGVHSQPRTANEKIETKVERPDLIITPDMTIVELGLAECIVENSLLIKGTTSGETQVLESGSILCLADRTLIGAVHETFGRVDQPLYSVAFTNAAEAQSSGATAGTKVFYVKEHSSYVFTKPLRLVKGSDASNLHDEEVGENELEFSDDEVEAEYKRQKKHDKLAKKGITPRSEFLQARGRDHSGPDYYSRSGDYPVDPIAYDDDEADGLYTPLTRPQEMGSHSIPPRLQSHRGRYDRDHGSRARGRGKGRGPESYRSRDSQPLNPSSYQMQALPQPTQLPQYPTHSAYAPPLKVWNNPSPSASRIPPPGSFINPAFFQAQTQSIQPNQTQAQLQGTARSGQYSAQQYSPNYPHLDRPY